MRETASLDVGEWGFYNVYYWIFWFTLRRTEEVKLEVLVIGAFGTIGKEVVELLSEYGHHVIRASRSKGDVTVDISSSESIKEMFEKIGEVDAIINVAGEVKVVPVEQMTLGDNMIAINSKLLGQMNLVLIGHKYLRDNGSITLTTGVTKDDPIVGGSSGAMANGGIASFVKSAANDFSRGIRINCVSPTIVDESFEAYKETYAGFNSIPARTAAKGYLKSINTNQTGQEFQIYR